MEKEFVVLVLGASGMLGHKVYQGLKNAPQDYNIRVYGAVHSTKGRVLLEQYGLLREQSADEVCVLFMASGVHPLTRMSQSSHRWLPEPEGRTD
jgi:hypothetical protein